MHYNKLNYFVSLIIKLLYIKDKLINRIYKCDINNMCDITKIFKDHQRLEQANN